MKRLGTRLVAALMASILLSTPVVSAATAGQLVFPFYDRESKCSTGTLLDTTISGGGTWNSGLQPPYILQQFMIEVLKDIAGKASAKVEDLVTKEHVLALVAFALGEGGDINNGDLYNPLNTGIDAPELIDGAHAGNGVQSFKSFDAGIEATARAITDSGHKRLVAALVDPSTTAEQFMYNLTYYQKFKEFPADRIWAEASMPPHQEEYYARELSFVRTARNSYGDIASLVVGTPVKEQIANITDASKLDSSLVPDGSSGEVTSPSSNDTSGSGTGCTTPPEGGGANATGPVGEIGASSESVQCPPNTKDIGVADSRYTGSVTKEAGHLRIRLCQLSSIGGTGNGPSGNQLYDGAVTNSRVAGAFEAMGEKAKAEGVPLSAGSSFRLADSGGGGGDGTLYATAGHSAHQLGIAIDFNGTHRTGSSDSSCGGRARDPGSPVWSWLLKNADAFGIKQYSYESWHWDFLNSASRCDSKQ